MALPEQDRSRPAGNQAASNVISSAKIKTVASVPAAADHLADLDALAESLRGYFVVQVVIDDDGHRRTHVYRSAGAAERAVQRARARGRIVHVTLTQMMPIGVVSSLGGVR